MKASGYAEIMWEKMRVQISCTDSEVLDRLLADMKNLFSPNAGIEKIKYIYGEMYFYELRNLHDQDLMVGYWLLKQFCLLGWEPFDVESAGINPIQNPRLVRLRLPVCNEQ